jgi:hypothetical protein
MGSSYLQQQFPDKSAKNPMKDHYPPALKGLTRGPSGCHANKSRKIIADEASLKNAFRTARSVRPRLQRLRENSIGR